MAQSKLDEVVSLAKRRGFVFPAGEIYGGTRSAWDYGPLGVALKDNIKREWWRSMVVTRGDVVGVDTSIILPPAVWVASGHVSVFNDPLIECLNCHKRHRADKLEESYAEKHGDKLPENGLKDIVCPDCGTRGNWTEPRDFNMMLRTHLGPVEDENSLHYLRPETAQGIFVDFKNVMTSSRSRPPFGIANMGKSFRNEITPGNFIFRTREFEQMEMEFFVAPGTDEEWHQYWIDARTRWYIDLGVKPENLRHYEHPKEKLAHYSKRTVDIEYKFGFQGSDWGELEGMANRTDYDLSAHSKHSGEDLSYFNQATGEKVRAVRHRTGRRPDPLPSWPSLLTPTMSTRRRIPRAASTSAPCFALIREAYVTRRCRLRWAGYWSVKIAEPVACIKAGYWLP